MLTRCSALIDAAALQFLAVTSAVMRPLWLFCHLEPGYSLKDTSSACVLVQPDGWARGEREGYGGPRDVTSLSLSQYAVDAPARGTARVPIKKQH